MNYQIVANLVKSAKLLKQMYTPQLPLLQQCQKYGVIDYLNFKFIPRKHPKNGIGIRTIYCNDGLRISIYYVPKNEIMKIHDHQGMKIMSYVMEGDIQQKSYTHLGQNIYQRKVSHWKKGDFAFIDGQKNNLHEMKAIQNSLFLDIIFPDYNENNPCQFFKEQEDIGQQRFKLKKIDDDILLHDI